MGQRRKHVTQTASNQDVEPPADNQQIVRALGARGGNIVEVSWVTGIGRAARQPVGSVDTRQLLPGISGACRTAQALQDRAWRQLHSISSSYLYTILLPTSPALI